MDSGFPPDITRTEASINKQEKIEIALEMHKKAYTYREIGEKLGVSKQCVHAYIKKELSDAAERRMELGDTIVGTELSRLEAVIKLCMRDLETQVIEWIEDESTGEKVPSTTDRLDNHVAQTMFKAIEQKAKLLGLYKASQVKHDHKHLITTIEDLVVQSKPLVIEADVKALTINEEGQDLDD